MRAITAYLYIVSSERKAQARVLCLHFPYKLMNASFMGHLNDFTDFIQVLYMQGL